MGNLKIFDIKNKDLGRRPIFVRPPEPPEEFLMNDPTNSIYIGRTKIFHIPFSWTYAQLTNPHICVVGITGSGKSYFVKTFLTRAYFVWGTNALIIDWAGEYKEWVKQTGGRVIALGKGAYVNLLDSAGMRPTDRIKQIIRTLEILTDIGQYPEQRRLTEQAIEKAYLDAGFRLAEKIQKDELGNALVPPTLHDVKRILEEKLEEGTYEFPAELENAIYRIKQFTREGEDYFAGQSTINLEELTHSGLVDIDLSGLPDEVFRGLAALSFLQFIKEKMREEGWSPEKGIKLIVVLDEAWKVAKDDNSDAVMIVREGRKYQFGLVVASQNPTDINEAIFSNVGTTFILRVKFERFLDYLQATLNFSDFMRHQISMFGVGQCAVNMAFQTSEDFSETFLLDRIDGEEPLEEYFLDMGGVLTEAERRDENVAKVYSFERNELRRKLRTYGLDEMHIEELATLFEKHSRHMDVVNFVVMLERWGLARQNITGFLKEIGMDDPALVNVFAKADYKRLGVDEKSTQEVALSD
ncbi:MAG: ATP-binding protein [Candidatus Micrarchaeota archaeon]